MFKREVHALLGVKNLKKRVVYDNDVNTSFILSHMYAGGKIGIFTPSWTIPQLSRTIPALPFTGGNHLRGVYILSPRNVNQVVEMIDSGWVLYSRDFAFGYGQPVPKTSVQARTSEYARRMSSYARRGWIRGIVRLPNVRLKEALKLFMESNTRVAEVSLPSDLQMVPIIIGAPGSGKSTLIKEISLPVFETDDAYDDSVRMELVTPFEHLARVSEYEFDYDALYRLYLEWLTAHKDAIQEKARSQQYAAYFVHSIEEAALLEIPNGIRMFLGVDSEQQKINIAFRQHHSSEGNVLLGRTIVHGSSRFFSDYPVYPKDGLMRLLDEMGLTAQSVAIPKPIILEDQYGDEEGLSTPSSVDEIDDMS
jgi:hypothetical protein